MRILVVAGSDPTAGAGLQADLKAIHALGGYALTVVTAVTVQDTARVWRVEPLAPELVAAQMRAVLADVGADAVKLGMLASAGIVQAVAEVLADHPRLPVAADPVLAGTHGGTLLDGAGLALWQTRLLPRLTLLTPNLAEAGALCGLPPPTTPDGMEQAARRLAAAGPAVLVTGGHLAGDTLVEVLVTASGAVSRFSHPRLPGISLHGTGCLLTSAIATRLGQGLPLETAVAEGIDYVTGAWTRAVTLGRGQRLAIG